MTHHITCRIEWSDGHQCPTCEDADRPCQDCLADLADSEAELMAEGRRDER